MKIGRGQKVDGSLSVLRSQKSDFAFVYLFTGCVCLVLHIQNYKYYCSMARYLKIVQTILMSVVINSLYVILSIAPQVSL